VECIKVFIFQNFILQHRDVASINARHVMHALLSVNET